MKDQRPPRDNLCRASFPGFELRANDTGGDMPTLTGHFAVFNRWTEINSIFEGRFLERIAPGAFRKTFQEGRNSMKVLFQHGHDPQIGDKPLGPIRDLEEDSVGARYEVDLLDTSYVRDLIPGLEAGLYGASFRFGVVREEFVNDPEPSDHNPAGLPERTILEARVPEFGPVTFPAYADATAGLRSVTDEYILDLFARHPDRLTELVERRAQAKRDDTAPSDTGDGEESRDTATPAPPEPDTEPGRRDIAAPAMTPARAATSTAATRNYLTLRKDQPSWRLP